MTKSIILAASMIGVAGTAFAQANEADTPGLEDALSGLTGALADLFGAWSSDLYTLIPWVLLAVIMIAIAVQVALGMVSTALNAASKKQKGEHWLTLLEESMNEVVWVADEHLRVTYCSRSIIRLLGLEAKEVIGRPLTESFGRLCAASETSDGIVWAIHSLIAEAKVQRQFSDVHEPEKTLMVSLLHANGTPVRAEAKLWVQLSETGDVIRVRGAFRALTFSAPHGDNDDVPHITSPILSATDFWALCASVMESTKRSGDAIALIVVESDAWDNLNRRWGQDQALAAMEVLTEKMRSRLNDGAVMARLNSKRVALLHPYITLQEASHEAEAIRRSAAVSTIALGNGQTVNGGVSIGVTISYGREAVEVFAARAEGALVQAVQGGGNMVCMSVAPSNVVASDGGKR